MAKPKVKGKITSYIIKAQNPVKKAIKTKKK